MITFEKLLEAINKVEAGGRKKNVKAGDNGRAIGPLQIHAGYWRDALDWLKKNQIFEPVGNQALAKCEEWEYSKFIAFAYFKLHAPKALREGNWEVLSRVHNGGPYGHLKKATLGYWEKVKEALRAMGEKP